MKSIYYKYKIINNYIKVLEWVVKSGWLVVLPEDWAITGALMGLKSRGLKW